MVYEEKLVRDSGDKELLETFHRQTTEIKIKFKIGNILKYFRRRGYYGGHKKEYIVEKVVKKLKDYSLINDKNYAESYIHANKNFSINKLKQKLHSFGVSSNDFECLENLVDDNESCVKHCEKFLKNKLPNLQTKDKLIRRLLGMGYSWETIKSSLKNFDFESEEN